MDIRVHCGCYFTVSPSNALNWPKRIDVSDRESTLLGSLVVPVSRDVNPSDLIVSIREFVGRFFLCEECALHFVNMTANAEKEVNTFDESVLYLWRGALIEVSFTHLALFFEDTIE